MGRKAGDRGKSWDTTRRWSRPLSSLLVLMILVAGPEVLAAPPANPAKAARAALDAAIDELRKEYLAHQRDPKQPLRKSCDYFTARPNPAVTLDPVFLAIEQRIDADLFLSAYV